VYVIAWVATVNTGPAAPRPKMLIESKDGSKLELGGANRGPALKFTAYELAATVPSSNFEDPRSPSAGNDFVPKGSGAPVLPAGSPVAPAKAAAGLDLSGVSRKWGAGGYDWNEPVEAAPAASTPSAVPPANRTVPTTSAPPPPVATVTTPVQSAPVPKRAEPVVKPRELTEREKMAAALFGGTGTTTPPVPIKRAGTTTPTPAPVKSQPVVASVAPAKAATPVAAKTGGGAVVNLLDTDVFSAFVTQPIVTSTPAVRPAGGFELSFLDGSGVVETKSSGPMGADAMSAQIRSRLDPLTKTPSIDAVLVSDERVQVSSYKAFAPDRTLLCFFISNKSSSPLSNVTVQVTGLAASFVTAFEGDSGLQVPPFPFDPFVDIMDVCSSFCLFV
jgi:hypothetical protein